MSEELAKVDQPEFEFYGLQLIDRAKPVWHCTGKILRRTRPEVHRIAIELLGAGRHSKREICELLHVSPHTLASIEADQAENLATLRQKAARKNLELHSMSLDRIEELIPRANDVAKLAVTAGILAEKSQLLAGEATARIEEIGPADLLQRFENFCGAIEKRAQAREIDGPGKETPANSEPGSADPRPGLQLPGGSDGPSVADRQISDPETDSISDVAAVPYEEQQTDPLDYPLESSDPELEAEPTRVSSAAAAEGGGGGQPAAARVNLKSVTP